MTLDEQGDLDDLNNELDIALQDAQQLRDRLARYEEFMDNLTIEHPVGDCVAVCVPAEVLYDYDDDGTCYRLYSHDAVLSKGDILYILNPEYSDDIQDMIKHFEGEDDD